MTSVTNDTDRNQTAPLAWKVFDCSGVEPVFPKKEQAIDYAQSRACFRSGEIQIIDSTGNVERIVAYSEADRKL
jgi:hypothetical protein